MSKEKKNSLKELVDLNELQSIQDSFAKTVGTSSVIFSPEGEPLTQFSNPTGFCSLIQSTEEGKRRCFQSFMEMCQKARELKEPIIHYCFAHSGHFVAPIIIGGEHRGTMFAGQFIPQKFSDEQLKELEKIAAGINVDPQLLVEEAKKMRVVEEDKIWNYSSLLFQIEGVIARVGAQSAELTRTKDALQKAHDELEIRVQERTAELAKSNEELKREIDERKKAEEKLRLFSQAADSSIDGVAMGNHEGRITYVNDAFVRMFGYSREELIGNEIAFIYAKDQIPKLEKALKATMDGGWIGELVGKRKNGEIFPIAISSSLVKDDEGNVIAHMASHEDISERKRADAALRETRERLAVTLKSIGDGVIATDAKGRVTLMNDVAQELTGWKIDEAIGLPSHEIFRIINEKTRNPVEDPIARVLREGNIVGLGNHSVLIARDGTERAIADSGAPIKASDGTTIGVVLVFRDVTEKRKVEEEREAALNNLAETNMKLEERANELEGARLATLNIAEDLDEARIEAEKAKEELEETNIKLERSNRELHEFTYIASHDLREPMRKISAFGQLLQESLTGKLDEDEEENFAFMIDGATRMQQMIDDLLVYSRVTTQAKPAKRVDLNKAIADLKSVELAALLEETCGTVRVPEPLLSVQADHSQAYQLLQNLIGNGLKFHREGISPEIIVRSKQENNNMVRVEVEDNGIGIEEANYEKIFGMFQRLYSREGYKGSGIGLAVCKKIVERHGGSIGIKSTQGKGSTFWFTMPTITNDELRITNEKSEEITNDELRMTNDKSEEITNDELRMTNDKSGGEKNYK